MAKNGTRKTGIRCWRHPVCSGSSRALHKWVLLGSFWGVLFGSFFSGVKRVLAFWGSLNGDIFKMSVDPFCILMMTCMSSMLKYFLYFFEYRILFYPGVG